MNYIPKICEMLGLEWDEYKCEIFEEFYFDYYGLKGNTIICAYIFADILSGMSKILKKPWQPKDGEMYYMPEILTKSEWTYSYFDNQDIHRIRLRAGLVFKTQEEAISKAKEIIEMLKGGSK